VRAAKSGKLLAFISAIPADLRISDREQRLVEINFLCVHKKLRAKRLAPVLIMEITRRVHQEGIFQACFTAGVFLPTPVARCRYWHRSLNPKKLIDVRFSQLHPKMTMAMTVKMYKVPEVCTACCMRATANTYDYMVAVSQAPVTPGFRAMEPKDVAAVAQLHKEYQAQFKMTPVFTEDECAHWLLPRDKVVSSYVVEDPKTNQVVDFTSFYALNSTVIGHPRHKTLNAAYAFYTTSFTVPLKQMLQDALIMANKVCPLIRCMNSTAKRPSLITCPP
jgi:glycylpeptide N-tetradecanoyltransferase